MKRRVGGTRLEDEHIIVERSIRPAWLAFGTVGIGAVLAALKCVIDAVGAHFGP